VIWGVCAGAQTGRDYCQAGDDVKAPSTLIEAATT